MTSPSLRLRYQTSMRYSTCCRVACAIALLASEADAAFATASTSGRSALIRPVASLRPAQPRFASAAAVPPAQSRCRSVDMRLPAAVLAPIRMRGVMVRAMLACLASIVAVFLNVGRAYAVERTVRRAATPLISGDVLKYGAVGGLMLAGYVFQKEDSSTVRFYETPGAEAEEPTQMEEGPTARNQFEDLSSASTVRDATDGAEPQTDDAFSFNSLQARMKQLADERAAAEEAEARGETLPADEPVSDSTDSWGEGNTAVLEPPRREDDDGGAGGGGVLDGPPAVEFPTGFPIVDGEVVEVDNTPAASDDQIAMLNRMMGFAEPEE